MKICPACSGALEEHQVDRFSASVCNDCGGIWFSHDAIGDSEFGKMMHDKDLSCLTSVDPGPASEPPMTHVPTKCPDCGLTLREFHYDESAIIIYRCDGCVGTFLPFDQLKPLHDRQIKLFNGYVQDQTDAHGAEGLSPEVRAAAATLDAMTEGNEMRAHYFMQRMNAFDRPWGWY